MKYKELISYIRQQLELPLVYCFKKFKMTESFCKKNNLDFEKVKKFLAEKEITCDCKLIWLENKPEEEIEI